MAKFSQQLLSKAEERMAFDPTKLSRTQRKRYGIAVEKAKAEAELEYERRKEVVRKTEGEIGGLSLEGYKKYYVNVKEDWLKDLLTSPETIEAEQQEQTNKNITKANEYVERYKQEKLNYAERRRGTSGKEYQRWTDKINKAGYSIDYWQDAKGEYLSKGVDIGSVRSWVQGNVEYEMAKEGAEQSAKAKVEQREKEISELVRQGYSPQIDKIYKEGKVSKAYVSFYKKGEGYKRVTGGMELGIVDVGKLSKSEVGKQKIPISYELGGKTFTMYPDLQTYVTPTGKLSTALTGELKITEKEFKSKYVSPPMDAGASAYVLQGEQKEQKPVTVTSKQSEQYDKKSGGVDVDKIVKDADASVNKKRKWGIFTGKNIFGIPSTIGIKPKTNPSFPPLSSDRLTTIKAPSKPSYSSSSYFKDAGKFVAKSFYEIPVEMYKGVAKKMGEFKDRKQTETIIGIPPSPVSSKLPVQKYTNIAEKFKEKKLTQVSVPIPPSKIYPTLAPVKETAPPKPVTVTPEQYDKMTEAGEKFVRMDTTKPAPPISPEDEPQKTKVGKFTKAKDLLASLMINPLILMHDIQLPSKESATGTELQTEYIKELSETDPFQFAFKDYNPLSPISSIKGSLAYPRAVIGLYKTQQKYREKSNLIKDAIANVEFDAGVRVPPSEVNIQTIAKNLQRAGVDPLDIKTDVTSKVTKEGYITSELIGGETVTTTYEPEITTTTGLGIDLDFKSQLSNVAKGYADKGEAWKGYALYGTYGASKITQAYALGTTLSALGITGGVATEGGYIGRSLTTLASKSPVIASVLEFGSKPATQLTMVGLFGLESGTGVISSSVKTVTTGEKFELGGGYKFGEETGLNPYVTALMGGGKGAGQYYGFIAGATGGEISPIKAGSFETLDKAGKITKVSTLSVGEPFSGKYYALGTKVGGKTFLGYAPKSAFEGLKIGNQVELEYFYGTPEGQSFFKHYGAKASPEYSSVSDVVGKLRDVKVKGVTNVDLAKQKTFADISKAQQLEWTKQMQSLGDVGKISPQGEFRRFTGSITQFQGGVNRPAGDIDVVLGTRADANKIANNLAEIMGKGFVAKGSQVYFQGTKVFEGLTPELAIPQPMGYFGKYSAPATISGTSGVGSTGTTVTKAGQSLTELGSAVTLPSIDASGNFVYGVNIDKTQRVLDLYKTGQMLSALGGGKATGSLEAVKVAYSNLYPNLDWEGGIVASASAISGGTSSTSALLSSSATSTAMAVFMPEGASSTSTNVQVFVPQARSRSSITSLAGIPPTVRSSLSSFSSFSSPSSISSPSSPSSLSSSVSSLSSLSSSSSSSSSVSSLSSLSSSSSSSSSGGAGGGGIILPFIPPVWFGLGGDGGRRKKRLKKSIAEKGYVPSFTAKIIGLKPVTITPAQAEKLLQKSFTGFELRPSVRVSSGQGYKIPKNILNPKVVQQRVQKKMQSKRKNKVKNKVRTKVQTKLKMPKFPTVKVPKF